MNEFEWMYELQSRDTGHPVEQIDEAVYTVFRNDFLRMPDVDFHDLATSDPSIQALMN